MQDRLQFFGNGIAYLKLDLLVGGAVAVGSYVKAHDLCSDFLLQTGLAEKKMCIRDRAHTLGAVYDTPHGVECAMMLPIVMEYNQECTGEKYREIARAMGVKDVDSMTQDEYRKAAIDAVRKLSVDVGIPTKPVSYTHLLVFLCVWFLGEKCGSIEGV